MGWLKSKLCFSSALASSLRCIVMSYAKRLCCRFHIERADGSALAFKANRKDINNK